MVYVAGVVKVGVVDVDISILSHLKEELTWATGKQLQVISTIIIIFIIYITKELKNKAIFIFKTICLCCYVALSNILL